jgi:hypothetical protein
VFVTVPIQLSHERRQVFRNRGAGGVGEFGPQSGRKCLQELHRVEGDGGHTAHPQYSDGPPLAQPFGRAPYVVNTTEAILFRGGGKIFAGNGTGGSRGRQRTGHRQRGADVPRPFPFSQYPHAEGR